MSINSSNFILVLSPFILINPLIFIFYYKNEDFEKFICLILLNFFLSISIFLIIIFSFLMPFHLLLASIEDDNPLLFFFKIIDLLLIISILFFGYKHNKERKQKDIEPVNRGDGNNGG